MDIKTILLSLFIVNLFMGFFTYVIKKTQPTFRGINFWIYSNIFIAFGYLLLALRNSIPEYLSIVLAQNLFLYAGFIRIYGLNKFFDKPNSKSLVITTFICIPIYLFLILYFTYFQESMFVRTVLIGLFLSSMAFFTGLLIYRNRSKKSNYSYIISSAAYFIFSAIFIIRIISWMLFPSIRGLFETSFINEFQFVSSMIIDISWTTLFFVIHNQKLTNQLQESEEKFRTIFQNNSSATALIDFDSTIVMVNKAFCQLGGYEENEVIGSSWTKFIPPEDLDRLKEYNRKRTIDPNSAPDKYEFTFYKKNGEIRHGLMSIAVVPSIHLITCSFIDITERRLNEISLQNYSEELDQLNKGKDRFMSILAHDLKNPFNVLLNATDLLLDKVKTTDKHELERKLALIYQTALRTYNLLEDLLMWSMSNSGKLQFHPQAIDFKNLINDVSNILYHQAEEKNIDLKVLNRDNLLIYADLNMLRTIMRNLITNAIKFTHSGGHVEVLAIPQENMVTISISDNGIGISKEKQVKLWDINDNNSTYGTNNEKGTGFGLLLCKELVERHGGNLTVNSEVGRGSVFIFTLPNQSR